MNDFDVLDDGMMNAALSDAQIEALIEGTTVPGVSPALVDLLASLRQRAAVAPIVAVSPALRAAMAGDPAAARHASASPSRWPAAASRRPMSVFAKVSSLIGLIPAYLLAGATVSAAAISGAHMLGIVDVPFLPERRSPVEAPVPPEPFRPATVPSDMVTSPADVVAPDSDRPDNAPSSSLMSTPAASGPPNVTPPTSPAPQRPPTAAKPTVPAASGDPADQCVPVPASPAVPATPAQTAPANTVGEVCHPVPPDVEPPGTAPGDHAPSRPTPTPPSATPTTPGRQTTPPPAPPGAAQSGPSTTRSGGADDAGRAGGVVFAVPATTEPVGAPLPPENAAAGSTH